MKSGRGVFLSQSFHWRTPATVYARLHEEFHFTKDPVRFHEAHLGGLESWAGERVFCNPPYGPEIPKWLARGREAEVAVYLLPARTDTGWFHDCLRDAEIRFVRGRLKFGDSKHNAPFPSVLVIFRKKAEG